MEITGLDFGTYNLHEIVAPKGYAIPADGQKFEFTVNANSYNKLTLEGKNSTIDSTTTDKTQAQRLVNKKVTIPQTGGIGTIIFTAIGLAIMASAVIAIKKRQATEAR